MTPNPHGPHPSKQGRSVKDHYVEVVPGHLPTNTYVWQCVDCGERNVELDWFRAHPNCPPDLDDE